MCRIKNNVFRKSICVIGLIASLVVQADASLDGSINKHQKTFEDAAMQIWNWAEVGYKEFKSAELLKTQLRDNGFTISSGVADIPTAFIAEFSNGGPVVGILGEYDALPGLMQTASPFKEPRADVSAGHACGHHMFGAASGLGGRSNKRMARGNQYTRHNKILWHSSRRRRLRESLYGKSWTL
jgi:aminobenzoyl-glutamate utilization protein B